MKKIWFLLGSLLFSVILSAQDIKGNWQGTLDANGQKLRIIFHLKKDDNQYSASFDSPDQAAMNLPCEEVAFTADSIIIAIKVLAGDYRGKWNGSDEITGVLSQRNYQLPLTLSRMAGGDLVVKPQTPKPPFNYLTEDVEYDNTVQQVHLGATLTKPKGDGKFPVAVMITGSGQQDRDESIGMHKPFAVIADYLTKQGIAVLRVDDRGVGKSTGDFKNASSADFATDVLAGISYLKTRSDIDVNKIGLIGHSEGGIIAPYVAARSKDVAFIITLAGPIVGGQSLNDYQNTLSLTEQHVGKADIDAFLLLHHALVAAAINIENDSLYKAAIETSFIKWKQQQSAATLQTLIHGDDTAVVDGLQKNYAAFRTPWWRFIMTYDPVKDVERLSCAVFALNGEKDAQVESAPNLTAFKEALKKSKCKKFEIYEVAGVNHLFQHCKECGSIQEYLALDETFDKPTLAMMAKWINETVNK